MIAYGIGILPLIKNLRREITDFTQPWNSDDAGDLGTFTRLETYFDSLKRQGPGRGYYPKPSKSVLIIRLENIEAGKVFGAHHRFKVCTGTRYLGSYISNDESKNGLLRERTLTWEKNINTVSKTVGKYPQESYATVVCEIQLEWIFLQHVTWDTGHAFAGVEKMIQENFLCCLFFGKKKTSHPL